VPEEGCLELLDFFEKEWGGGELGGKEIAHGMQEMFGLQTT